MSLLVLVHHGDAVGPDVDPMRPLSSVGRAATERLAAVAAATRRQAGCDLAQRQTSGAADRRAFWKACNPLAPFTAERGLLPDDPPQWIRDRLTGESERFSSSDTCRTCRGCSH